MPQKLTVFFSSPAQARSVLKSVVFPFISTALQGGGEWTLSIKPKKRSDDQNARLWAMLTDVSRQVNWYGQKLTPEEWKHVMSASLKKQKVVPGLDGGFVVMGQSTSVMGVREMCELQELIEAFGAEREVVFTIPESQR